MDLGSEEKYSYIVRINLWTDLIIFSWGYHDCKYRKNRAPEADQQNIMVRFVNHLSEIENKTLK